MSTFIFGTEILGNSSFPSLIIHLWINSGPREDATRIGSAGVVRRQAVDISPLRRVNQAIYLLTTGARESAFRNVKTIAECLADELINAAKGSSNRYKITNPSLNSLFLWTCTTCSVDSSNFRPLCMSKNEEETRPSFYVLEFPSASGILSFSCLIT